MKVISPVKFSTDATGNITQRAFGVFSDSTVVASKNAPGPPLRRSSPRRSRSREGERVQLRRTRDMEPNGISARTIDPDIRVAGLFNPASRDKAELQNPTGHSNGNTRAFFSAGEAMVDLGTLGGPNSNYMFGARSKNGGSNGRR
jgi:hypothetical protein